MFKNASFSGKDRQTVVTKKDNTDKYKEIKNIEEIEVK